MKISILCFDHVNDEVLDDLERLENLIFDQPYSREKIEQKLFHKRNLLILTAFIDDKPVGFKVGFELTRSLFYSWIGGVAPASRKHGVATRLMEEQHTLAKKQGYKFVRTETENRFRSMLILNIKFGFDVVGIRSSDQYPRTIITLEKKLQDC